MRKLRGRGLIGLAAALLIGAGVFAWYAGARRHPRVLLIGIDGADPAIVERLIAEGKLPTLARLRREGAFGRLQSREPLLSPIVWTSIATGRKPQDHGVLDFVEAAPDGHAMPITSTRRRVPALWNIATQYGRTSGFIGWYASFPAERVRGFELSDRLAFHQVASEQATDGATFPPELAKELPVRIGAPSIDLAAVRARFVAPEAPLSADGERRVSQLARIYATSEYYKRAATWLEQRYRPELLGVYFEAIDACGHLFMEDAPPRRVQVADVDFVAFSQTVERCYAYQDGVLADLLTLADEDTVTIVCSDHGFKSGERRPDTEGRADEGQAPLWHLPNGVIFVRGRSVKAGSTISRATILDVAPTVLRALDLPLARDLPGRPIDAINGGAAGEKPREVAKYEFIPAPAPPAASRDPESTAKLDELRALGYLSPSSSSARPAIDGRFAASYLNEGIALYVDGESNEALRAFDRAMALDSRNVNARAFAARVHLERREYEQAAPLLDEAVSLDPRSVYVRLLRANLAISTASWDRAEAELAAAAALDSRLPMLYIQRARLLDARGDLTGALGELRTAEALTDSDPMLLDILVLRADAASRLGRASDAAAALSRASELTSGDRLAAARAELALTRGDAPAAVKLLTEAAEKSPQSGRLWALVGAAYGRGGQFDKAIDAYERSVALDPTPLACKTLAALIFEIRGDRSRAISLWQQSLELDRNQPDVRRFLDQYGDGSKNPAR